MKHTSVLVHEVIKTLAPQPNQNFIDLTLGFGGHSAEILKKTAPEGKLLGIEQDLEAIREAQEKLAPFGDRVTILNANFTEIGLLIRQWPIKEVDGILIDLGPNTAQLTSEERGFSFRSDAPLDMRMDPQRQKTTAADILNKYSQREIADMLFAAEERFAKQIAKKIVEYRKKSVIKTSDQLVEIIKTAMPPSYRYEKKTHFATGTFRGLRIAVNDELGNLKNVLPQAVSVLSPGGKIAVITFHSLEDRIVKNYFQSRTDLEILTKKPITATTEEILANPNARSAKLRVAQKLI